MKIGDTVINKNGPYSTTEGALASGCEWYTHAIVVSMEPFVLVSEEGDMLWATTKKPEYFTVSDKTRPTAAAFARWERENFAGARDVDDE